MRRRFTVLVKNDLFNIADRLKKIDKSYFVLFNKKTKNYEIHSKAQKGSTLCVIAGKKLNEQVIFKVENTKIKFMKKIIYDINSNNKKLEDKSSKDLQEFYGYKLEKFASWANKKNCDIDFSNLDKTIWI